MVTFALRPPILNFLPGSRALAAPAVGIKCGHVLLALHALAVTALIAELVSSRTFSAVYLVVNLLEEVFVLAL